MVRCFVARVSGDSFLRRAGVFVLYINFCMLNGFESKKSGSVRLDNILCVNLRELTNFLGEGFEVFHVLFVVYGIVYRTIIL